MSRKNSVSSDSSHVEEYFQNTIMGNDKTIKDANNIEITQTKTPINMKSLQEKTNLETTFTIENEKTTDNFLIQKFLTQSNCERTREITFVKPPVPLPRKSITKINSNETSLSEKTFSIASANIDNISIESHATFNIEKETEKIDSPRKKDFEIGDIVIHDSPSNKNIIIVNNKNKINDDFSSLEETITQKIKNKYKIDKNLESSEKSDSEIIFNKKKNISKKDLNKNKHKNDPVSSDDDEISTKGTEKKIKIKNDKAFFKGQQNLTAFNKNKINFSSDDDLITEEIEKKKKINPEKTFLKENKIKNMYGSLSSSDYESNNNKKKKISSESTPNKDKDESKLKVTKNKYKTTSDSYDSEEKDVEVEISKKDSDIIKKKRKSSRTNSERNVDIKKSSKKDKVKDMESDLELKELSSSKKKSKSKRKDDNVDLGDSELNEWTYEYFIGVVVYKSDHLLLNSFISHPIVKVHIVDSTTGEYIKKSNCEEYLNPMITKAFDLAKRRSLIPFWEELLIFEEDFEYMLNYKNEIIIFFEILDFLSFQTASLKYSTEGQNSGWYKVAWAFLKPVGKNGNLNIETKIRLQLYKTKKYTKSKKCHLYEWWASKKITKYPSSLHVNVKRIKSENKKYDEKDSKEKSEKLLNDDEYEKKISIDEFDEKKEDVIDENVKKISEKRIWSRISTQSCKIPNKILYKLKTGDKGCITLKFSNNGLYLAYGSASESNFVIYILNVTTGKQYMNLLGHFGLIYDLNWSSNDKYLLSASADQTVYIWDIYTKNSNPIQILPHPSYVYCCQFNPKNSEIITGCFDKIIRIWRQTNDGDFNLIEELENHIGYVTSLCFAKNGQTFYSSDSLGVILEWILNDYDWTLNRSFKFSELKNTMINNIALHPGGKRLFICCRDSIHRMMDVSVGCIVQWFRGALNYRMQLKASISPCGNLIISPSEDGSIFIWDTDTASLQASFTSYPSKTNNQIIPYCIQYHPFDHMLAIGHHGINISVIISIFDKKSIGSEDFSFKDLTFKMEDKQLNTDRKKKSKRKDVFKRDEKNVNLETIIEKLDEVIVSARGDN